MTQSGSGLPAFKSNFRTLELIYFGDILWNIPRRSDCSVLVVDLGIWVGGVAAGVLLCSASTMAQAIANTSSYSSAKKLICKKYIYIRNCFKQIYTIKTT